MQHFYATSQQKPFLIPRKNNTIEGVDVHRKSSPPRLYESDSALAFGVKYAHQRGRASPPHLAKGERNPAHGKEEQADDHHPELAEKKNQPADNGTHKVSVGRNLFDSFGVLGLGLDATEMDAETAYRMDVSLAVPPRQERPSTNWHDSRPSHSPFPAFEHRELLTLHRGARLSSSFADIDKFVERGPTMMSSPGRMPVEDRNFPVAQFRPAFEQVNYKCSQHAKRGQTPILCRVMSIRRENTRRIEADLVGKAHRDTLADIRKPRPEKS
ncbi:hypothetical protein THAOC_29778 [Thalassiosira oceanica]|uniref:Uncharacterized protein n=1 Tax=Thalassiosira oceanica TaxID=159749 RepID=K0RQF2_THAOC|nr:hypothetical protein THAOC_29778 [Thalassiosira oceanica]|eukprot:EJK51086.1 hypothetical protein THAOC_29778 [Thalassiosira oceanica]